MKIKSYIGHRFREAFLHLQRMTSNSNHHSVVILASMYGSGSSGDLRGKALSKELKKLGWRGYFFPPHLELSQRKRLLRRIRPDVILMQQSRHPLNHPKLYPGYPIVFDVDDADIYDRKCRGKVIECCKGSVAVTVGNRFLGTLMRPYNSNVHVIWTGSYLPTNRHKKWSTSGGRIVSWANSGASVKSAESDFLQRVLCALSETTDFEFRIYGVNNQETAECIFSKLKDMNIKIRSFKMMPYKKLARKLRSSDVGLAPLCEENPFSRGKSFGKVLTYLAAKVPVVASWAVDYPLFFQNEINGVVLPNRDVDGWARSIRRLLGEPQHRKSIAEKASEDYQKRLTVLRSAILFADVLKESIKKTGEQSVF